MTAQADNTLAVRQTAKTFEQGLETARGAVQLLWPRDVHFPQVKGSPADLPIARITWFRLPGMLAQPDRVAAGWTLAADQSDTLLGAQSPHEPETAAFHPSADQLLADPAASTWFKTALRSALDRDPVKAAGEAEVLAQVLGRRADAALRRALDELRVAAPADQFQDAAL